MADKSSINKAFNTLIFNFIDDIISIYPEQEDISIAKTSLMTFKQMNPTIVTKSWYKMVYIPYKDVIDAGDITFFFEKDYNADLQNIPNGKEIMKVIDKIRKPISQMDEKNKGHCAEYITKLSKLSQMYASM